MAAARTSGWLDLVIRAQLNWSNLTAERERQLLRICQTDSDNRARQAALTDLWESHSKLVVAIASRYRQPNIELADLLGAGHLGLHAAIARFDAERFEGRLANYAIGWIRWHIQDYIRRNAAPVRLPATTAHRQLAQMAGRLFADARRSCHRESVEATEAELCARIGQRIGLAGDEVARSIRLISGGAVSLHTQVTRPAPRGTWRTPSRTDDARPKRTSSCGSTTPRRASASWLWCRRSWASGSGSVPRPLHGRRRRDRASETLARHFGVTRERVCQLEASAKRKITTALAQEGYADFAGERPITLPATRAKRRRSAARMAAGTRCGHLRGGLGVPLLHHDAARPSGTDVFTEGASRGSVSEAAGPQAPEHLAVLLHLGGRRLPPAQDRGQLPLQLPPFGLSRVLGRRRCQLDLDLAGGRQAHGRR